MIVGVGAARVRDLFKQARENAPAIVFIDELDAIGRARGQMAIGGSSEQEQTLNQILTEMDGFSSKQGIIVLAATNQPDVLDKALLRPGRFDRRVIVNLPDKVGREAILKVHTRGVPLAPEASLEEIAASTPGFSGADLKNLVNEAALLAAKRNQKAVRNKDLIDALEKIILGPERPILLSKADKERIAYHEGGHAILGLVVPGADPVHRVTIVPRGQALGVTYQRPESDRYNYPEAYLRARITGILGGRAAEEVVYGTRTTGAESDIEQATNLARAIAKEMDLSEDQIDGIRMAGVIHDLGKISVPAEILTRPGKLTPLEFSLIKTHPQVAYDILKTIEFPWPVAEIVYQHHEKIDGSGYPRGLRGDEILIEARILTVADVVEAMSSHRPYRASLGIESSLDEIMKNRGVLYDPTAVDACINLFSQKSFRF